MLEPFPPRMEAWKSLLGLTLLITGSIAFSLGFACAMPFAALGAVAACTLPRRDAFLATLLVWLANQAIGFVFLQYPWTANCLAWGGAIGLSSLLCTWGACRASRKLGALPPWLACALAFAVAFGILESAFFAFSLFLGGTENFTPSILVRILGINSVALGGLFALHRMAALLGIARAAGEVR